MDRPPPLGALEDGRRGDQVDGRGLESSRNVGERPLALLAARLARR